MFHSITRDCNDKNKIKSCNGDLVLYLMIMSCGKQVFSSGITDLRLIVIYGNDAESNVGDIKPIERVT